MLLLEGLVVLHRRSASASPASVVWSLTWITVMLNDLPWKQTEQTVNNSKQITNSYSLVSTGGLFQDSPRIPESLDAHISYTKWLSIVALRI